MWPSSTIINLRITRIIRIARVIRAACIPVSTVNKEIHVAVREPKFVWNNSRDCLMRTLFISFTLPLHRLHEIRRSFGLPETTTFANFFEFSSILWNVKAFSVSRCRWIISGLAFLEIWTGIHPKNTHLWCLLQDIWRLHLTELIVHGSVLNKVLLLLSWSTQVKWAH